MSKQKKFKKEVVNRLCKGVEENNSKLIKLYLNKDSFSYEFKQDDFSYCNFEEIPYDLGHRMVDAFLNNLNQKKINDYRTADFECGKLLYENLKITQREASDIDFWNYLHHFDMYKYIHTRWSEIENPSKTSQKKYILSHWLMTFSSQRHLIVYPLTTLWWSFHLTFDETKEDPYELTKIYFKNNRYRTVTFGGSSYVRHKEAILGILEFFKDNNIPETKDNGDKISKYVNLLGGTKPLSFFNREWFKEQLFLNFKNLIQTEKKEDILDVKPDKTQILETKVIRYFNLYKDDHCSYSLTYSSKVDADFSVPITDEDHDSELLMYYTNGMVNKVRVLSLLEKNIDQHYSNGQNKDQTLDRMEIIKEPAILGLSYIKNNKTYFKAHLTDQLKDQNDSLSLKGKKLIYVPYFDKLQYKILPMAIKKDLGNLLFTSFVASGKSINSEYYRKNWGVISELWSDLFINKS